jgi:hypothetical protein
VRETSERVCPSWTVVDGVAVLGIALKIPSLAGNRRHIIYLQRIGLQIKHWGLKVGKKVTQGLTKMSRAMDKNKLEVITLYLEHLSVV